MSRADHLKAAAEIPWQVKRPRLALYTHNHPVPEWEPCPAHYSREISVASRGGKVIEVGDRCYRAGIGRVQSAYAVPRFKRPLNAPHIEQS